MTMQPQALELPVTVRSAQSAKSTAGGVVFSVLLHASLLAVIGLHLLDSEPLPPPEAPIPVEVVLLPAPELAPDPLTESASADLPEPVAAPEPQPETAAEPLPAPAPEPEALPAPEVEVAAEPEAAPLPEPETEPEPAVAPEPLPQAEPTPAEEPLSEPTAIVEAAPEPAAAPLPEPLAAEAVEPTPEPEIEAAPAQVPETLAQPEAPAPVAAPEPQVAELTPPLPHRKPESRPEPAITPAAEPPAPEPPEVAAEAEPPAPATEPPAAQSEAPAPRRLTTPATAQGLLANLAALRNETARAKADPELWAIISAVRAQIRECWLLSPEETQDPSLSVEIAVAFDKDGRLQRADIQDLGRLVRDESFKKLAVSAHRALEFCSPFDLPADKYAIWKSFTLRFVPHQPS